ncbi:MAG: hypothetical protein JXA07_02740 [Spirochaetes bacterium]|nr:hypothetical protein [Spirochaetota bacterium]
MKTFIVLIMAVCICSFTGCDTDEKESVIPVILGSSLSGAYSGGWYTMLGGTGNDYAYSGQQTADGGCIVAGYGDQDIPALQGKAPKNPYAASNDMLIIKLDSSGYVSWYTFLGGEGSDHAYSVQQTRDGGYIIAGSSIGGAIPSLQGKTPLIPYDGSYDMLVVKLNSSGNVSWYTFLGGGGSDVAFSVRQTRDGGYVLTGTGGAITSLQGKSPILAHHTGGDILVIKLSSTGNVSWYTFFGTSGTDDGKSVRQTADGGYIVAGWAGAEISSLQGVSPNNYFADDEDDMIVVKMDPSGDVAWWTYLGSTGYDHAHSVMQTSDGGYIVAGYAGANIPSLQGIPGPVNPYSGTAPTMDWLVVKMDSSGDASWYTFAGSSSGEEATSIQQTDDGGFIVAGCAYAASTIQGVEPVIVNHTGIDGLVVRLDESGNVYGCTYLGGPGDDRITSIGQTADGGYFVTGYSSGLISWLGGVWPLNGYSGANDMFLVKLQVGGSM